MNPYETNEFASNDGDGLTILGKSISAHLVNVSTHHRVYEMYTRFSRERKEEVKLTNLGSRSIFVQRKLNGHVRYVRLLIHKPGKKQ